MLAAAVETVPQLQESEKPSGSADNWATSIGELESGTWVEVVVDPLGEREVNADAGAEDGGREEPETDNGEKPEVVMCKTAPCSEARDGADPGSNGHQPARPTLPGHEEAGQNNVDDEAKDIADQAMRADKNAPEDDCEERKADD